MILETERLILRKWTQDDAESLFTYAKNPKVGPIAGWPPHKDIESSKYVIDNVFTGAECYAICEKENNVAIGAVELKLNGHTDMTDRVMNVNLVTGWENHSGAEGICQKRHMRL